MSDDKVGQPSLIAAIVIFIVFIVFQLWLMLHTIN